jgi:trehalose-6-phosphatase
MAPAAEHGAVVLKLLEGTTVEIFLEKTWVHLARRNWKAAEHGAVVLKLLEGTTVEIFLEKTWVHLARRNWNNLKTKLRYP